jgi:hypothetical protein
MTNRVKLYICAVVIAAFVSWGGLFVLYHDRPDRWLVAVTCMASWGLITQLLAHRIGGDSVGSIASIPYLAGAFLVAGWEMVAAIVAAEIIATCVHRRPAIKAIFNVAQVTLGFSLAILVYRVLGGTPMLAGGHFHLIAFLLGVLAAFATNTIAVSGVLALSANRSLTTVWRASTRVYLF